jgi:hypothetical protein
MEPLPREIQDILTGLDQSDRALMESEVFDQIQKEEKDKPHLKGDEALQAEVVAFAFSVYGRSPEDGEEDYFQPFMSGTDHAGKEHHFPDRDQVSPEFIAYWQACVEDVRTWIRDTTEHFAIPDLANAGNPNEVKNYSEYHIMDSAD